MNSSVMLLRNKGNVGILSINCVPLATLINLKLETIRKLNLSNEAATHILKSP